MMYTVLTSLNWLSLVHPDDIFMFVEIFEEHLEQLKLVLEAFRSANFTLKPEKCHSKARKVSRACREH